MLQRAIPITACFKRFVEKYKYIVLTHVTCRAIALRMSKISTFDEGSCPECNMEHTENCINGGRCMGCGSMLTHVTSDFLTTLPGAKMFEIYLGIQVAAFIYCMGKMGRL